MNAQIDVPEWAAYRLTQMLDGLWLLNKDKPGNTSAFCDDILAAFHLDQPRDRFLINAYVYKKMEPELLGYIFKCGTIPDFTPPKAVKP